MSAVKEKASRMKRLLKDDAFLEAVEEVKHNQVEIFINPNSAQEERESAHQVIQALSAVFDVINTAIAADVMRDKKLNQ